MGARLWPSAGTSGRRGVRGPLVQDCLRLPIVATVETAESRYRHPRHHLPGTVEVLGRVFANPMPLMAGAVGQDCDPSPDGADHQVIALAGTSVWLRSGHGAESVVLLAYQMASPEFAVIDGARVVHERDGSWFVSTN
jgi:hypothetical protein